MEEKKFDNILELIFKTSIFVFIGVLISKIFSYSYKIIIARYFGADIYGLYSLSIVIIGLLASVSSFGLGEGALRYISLYRGKKEQEKIKYVFRTSLIILLFSTIITSLIVFFSADFIAISIFKNPDLSIFLKIFSFMIPFWMLAGFFLDVMVAFEKIKQQIVIEKILQSAGKLIFLLFFLFLGFKTNAVIFSYFIGIFLFFLGTFLYCKYKLSEVFLKPNLNKSEKNKILKNLISYSVPVMFFALIANIFYWTDSIALGYFKTTYEVGIYNAAIPLAMLLGWAPELFIRLLFPIITKEYARKNIDLIKRLSKQIGKWIFIINFPVFFLMMFFPGTIINLFFGSDYLLAITSLRLLLIGNFFFSIFIISDRLLLMAGKSKILLMDLIIAGTLNIILNIILIPKENIFGLENIHGINGAAIATTISLIVFNLLLMFHAKYYTSASPLGKKFFRIFLISIIPISILFILKSLIEISLFSVIVITIFFFTIYVLLLFLMKGLDKNDLLIVGTLKNKIASKLTKVEHSFDHSK